MDYGKLKKFYECGDSEQFDKILNDEIDRQKKTNERRHYYIYKDVVADDEDEGAEGIKTDTSGKMLNRNYRKFREAMERKTTKPAIDRFVDSNIKEEVVRLDVPPTMTWQEAERVTGIDESILKSFVLKSPIYCRALALRNGQEVYSRALCAYAGQLRFELGMTKRKI